MTLMPFHIHAARYFSEDQRALHVPIYTYPREFPSNIEMFAWYCFKFIAGPLSDILAQY